MAGNEVTIRSNDRVAVVGKTGTGKTTLVQRLIWEPFDTAIFYDWKHQHYREMNYPVVHSIEDVESALFEEPTVDKFVYAPKRKSRDAFNYLCYLCWETGNTHLIADELKGVYQDNGWVAGITEYHEMIMTRGRQKGVGMTNVSQRPRGIPLETMSEAEHLFVFRLNLEDDRKRVGQIFGSQYRDMARELTGHEFLYYNVDMEQPRKCQPL